MIDPLDSPYLIPTHGAFDPEQLKSTPPADAPGNKGCRKRLRRNVEKLDDLQRRLYAEDRQALLLVFQAMDAAGKDSTIRAVMRGVNPAGCQVFSFKQPSKQELDHDFLWRTSMRLPERGRIGIFNRSHYEEVLVVRVHPEYLGNQRLELPKNLDDLWQSRYRSIRTQERHLAENGTVILKFWLNVSFDEQRRRFLSRLDEQEKNWKFSVGDVDERQHWNDYMKAYHEALAATSRPWAPWYAIPADNKPYMRWQVARIVRKTLEKMNPAYPAVSAKDRKQFSKMRGILGSS